MLFAQKPSKNELRKSSESSPDSSRDPEKNISEVTNEENIDDNTVYLSGIRLGLIVLGLCLAVLLVGLVNTTKPIYCRNLLNLIKDNSILSTAIPTITTSFNSLDDIGWYGSAFLICVCAFQPISGKLYQYFSIKWTYLFFLAIFELGSLLCATAVSSTMLIVGRAVAGMGAAGLFSGALVIVSHSIKLRQRPSMFDDLPPFVLVTTNY